MKNPVGWFEISVTDIDRAENYYKELLGFDFQRHPESPNGITMSFFPMDMSALGSPGALVLGSSFSPSIQGTLVYFTTASVENAVKKAEELGSKILMPKTDIGENGFIAWIQDSEGNRIAVHSMQG